MTLISLLIFIIIIALIVYLIGLIPLPAPWGVVARVAVAVVALLWLADRSGLLSGRI